MPVGAAGAIAGARRAKKRKQELERKQKQEQEKIEKWFKTFDTNHSGYLERDQLKALLTSLTPGGAEPEDGVLDGLMAKATPVDTTGDGKADQKGVDRKLVKGVVQKWFKYMKEKKAIDDIFAKFDTNGSGVLERDQLIKLLKCYCANPEPDEGDVDFVLEKADLSGTGTMRPEEVLPAIAVWKDLAEKKSSAVCVIA